MSHVQYMQYAEQATEEAEESDTPYLDAGRKRGKNGIIPDLADLEFPDNIKLLASAIYMELETTSLRKKNRKRAICYCIYQAYIDIDPRNVCDMPLIARKVGVPINEADSSVRSFSRKLSRYNDHANGFVSIESLINCYCGPKCLDMNDEAIEDVKRLWSQLKLKDPSLESKQARAVVASVILVFITKNDSTFVLDNTYASHFGLEVVTVINMRKYIDSLETRQIPKVSLESKVTRRSKR